MSPPNQHLAATLGAGPLWRRLRRTGLGLQISRAAQAAVDLPAAFERALHALSPSRLPADSPSRGALAHRLAPLEQGLRALRRRPDLSAEVSVCVATVGQPTIARTLAALERQDCRFAGPFLVRNVSPSGAALQRLTEVCPTPFFVQLGEDMVLKPYAVRAMAEAMRSAPDHVAGITYPLWDTHLQRAILGVKVLRTEILRRFPYQPVAGTGYDLEARLRAGGYALDLVAPKDYLGREVTRDPHCFEVMGEHVVEGETLLFERYQAVFGYLVRHESMDNAWQDLRHILGRLGLSGHPADHGDLWALLGAMAGLVAPPRGDRSYQLYRAAPGLREARYLINGGPEDVTLLCSGGGAAGPRELQRLLALYPRLRTARLLPAREDGSDPLAHPDLAALVRCARASGVRLVVETRGEAAGEAPSLADHEPALDVVFVVERPDVDSSRALAWLREGRALRRLRVHVDRLDLADADRRGALLELLREAEGRGVETELCHRLPGAEESAADFWERALCEDSRELELEGALKASAPGLRLPLPLRRQAPGGREWTRCDSPFAALAVDARGDISGCRAGLLPPAPGQGNLYESSADQLWFEHHPRRVRNELLGKLPLASTCRACHWNHSG